MYALNGNESVPNLNNGYVQYGNSDFKNQGFGIDITNIFNTNSNSKNLSIKYANNIRNQRNLDYATPVKTFSFDEFEKSTAKKTDDGSGPYITSSTVDVNINKLLEYNKSYEKKTNQICKEICDEINDFVLKEEDYTHKKQIPQKLKDFYTEEMQEAFKNLDRSSNINWILDNCLKFKWKENTFYLAVHFFDQCLQNKVNTEGIEAVKSCDLRLIAAACLLMGTKLEEQIQPRVSDFYFICSCKYSTDQIIEMEQEILASNNYRLVKENPCDFLLNFVDKISKDTSIDQEMLNKIKNLAKYVLESSIFNLKAKLKFKNSLIAISSLYIALKCLNMNDLLENIVMNTIYNKKSIRKCAMFLYRHLNSDKDNNIERKESDLRVIYRKFGSEKFGKISNFELVINSCDN